MSITNTQIEPLEDILDSAEYREFKEKGLVHSQGYQHFKAHEFIDSDRYWSIVDAYMKPQPSVTLREIENLSLTSFEQQLYAIMNYIASERSCFTKESLAQLSYWKQRATGIQMFYATQGHGDLKLNTLIKKCDGFFNSIPTREWLSCIIEERDILNTLSEKKIAKIFLKEKSWRTKEKYCIAMDDQSVNKIALFSPNGYYSVRWDDFKTDSNKKPLSEQEGKSVYTGKYVREWGIKDNVIVLTSLTATTANKEIFARRKEKELQEEFLHLQSLSGREIAVEPSDYFRITGLGNKIFGFLIEEYKPLGDLSDWLEKPHPLEVKKEIIDSLIQKICELHELGILHLDIKEENIVLHFNPKTKKHEIRLIDWDHAISFDSPAEKKSRPKGTVLCAPPEYARYSSAWKKTPEADYVSLERVEKRMIAHVAPSFDVWSLGVLLDQIYHGSNVVEAFVFQAEQERGIKLSYNGVEALIAKISQRTINDYFADKTDAIDLLIYGMLIVDPSRRFTMREVKREWDAINNGDEWRIEDTDMFF